MAGNAEAAGRCNAITDEEACIAGFFNGRCQRGDAVIVHAEIGEEKRYSAAAGLTRNRRFRGKRRNSGMNELACLHGSERYGACDDAVQDALFKGQSCRGAVRRQQGQRP